MKRLGAWSTCVVLLGAAFAQAGSQGLDSAVNTLADKNPAVKQTLDGLEKHYAETAEPPAVLKDLSAEDRANLATYIGRELVRRNLHDEALAVLATVQDAGGQDPATYLFHRAVCEFQLHKRNDALATIGKLEKIESPERYKAVGTMMKSILEGLKAEKLDGIAHDMRDLRRRLNNGHTTDRVVEIETSVIARLDKIIEELEQQGGSWSGCGGGGSPGGSPKPGSSGSPNGEQSSSPASDSAAANANGKGDVNGEAAKNQDQWGNLPSKEREKAVNGLGDQFPAHYRDAIREYMRRLATMERN